MGLRVGVSNVAVHLVVHRLVGHKAERLQQFVRVAGLAVQLAEVNAAAMYAGRGAGLEAAQRHTVGRQILGQRGGRMGAVRAAVIVGFAHKNAPAQRCAGSNHHALAAVIAAQRRYHPAHMAVLHIQPHDLRLVNLQVGGQLQRVLHPHVVALAVSLYAQAVYRRAFAAVQHPALQKGGVRRNAHQTAQRIDLPHQMPLGCAANGWVAGHVADKIQCQRKDRRLGAKHGCRMGGFNSGVSGTHHDHIIISQKIHNLYASNQNSLMEEIFVTSLYHSRARNTIKERLPRRK